MNVVHHPDDATLVSYAACSIEPNFSLVLDLHIRNCRRCQLRMAEAERLGAALLTQMPAADIDPAVRSNLFQMLDQRQGTSQCYTTVETALPESPDLLPDFITHWEEANIERLPWKRMGPGVRYIPLDSVQGKLFLLRIAPGTCLPEHGHRGNELTLVLSGSYSDEIGRFTPGCIADLDDEINHQPIADRSEDCICLVATDAPLQFHGWVPRLFQNFFQI